MKTHRTSLDPVMRGIGRTLMLTRAGMVAERGARAFWPLWSLVMLVAGLSAFGVQDAVPIRWAAGAVLALGFAALWYGLRRFRWPSGQEARDRLDRRLPGRPLTALSDSQAIGAGDGASRAVWQAHLGRMAARAAQARPVRPDLRLSGRDRFALRYVALTAFVMALAFGSVGRMGSMRDALPGAGGAAMASGPSWEGWIEPPRHTGLPGLYLNEIAAGEISVPVGSRVTLRLYGEVGALSVEETVSRPAAGDAAETPARAATASANPSATPSATATGDPMARDFRIDGPGEMRIVGEGGRAWRIDTIADAAPAIAFLGEMQREPGGRARQDFTASDDYGVTAARAEIRIDLAAVDRRFGLAADPEPRDPLLIDLPLSMTGEHRTIEQSLIDDFSRHPWANLPVRITLVASDAAGSTGTAERAGIVLPGRRFFDPLAAAVIEMRRDLLWSRENATRSARLLRAVTHRPEGFVRDEGIYLQLRAVVRRLEAGGGSAPSLTTEERDEIAAALWDIAIEIEDGDLASALERLRRAQDRLSEAMRNGADPSEITDLVQELREAMQDYMRQLAENAQRNPEQQAENQNTMEITGDQLQQMLQRLQELMEQGRMAEAAELLEQLRRMMENMQVTQGQQGQQGPGEQAMRDLADTLRQQQGLSDEAFGQLQEQFGQGEGTPMPDGRPQPGRPGQGQRGQGQEGQEGQQGRQARPGQPGQQPGADQGQSLADRQQALREQLRRLQERGLPFPGTEEGDAARRGLDDAGRAMEGAEEALRGEDFAEALDQQSQAMEALRESLRNMGEAMARNRQEGQGQNGRDFGNADPRGDRDPLGRTTGQMGRLGTDERLLQGEDVYRRAEELLEELRRRSGDQSRSQEELDYLRRLLDRF